MQGMKNQAEIFLLSAASNFILTNQPTDADCVWKPIM